MSRFQAQTNAVLEQELDDLRERLGLRENQKADLLREIAALASWVVRQAEAGRTIYGRRGQDIEQLSSATIERIRQRKQAEHFTRIQLDDEEVGRLAQVMSADYAPTPGLRKALLRLADPKRSPPKLRWRKNRS